MGKLWKIIILMGKSTISMGHFRWFNSHSLLPGYHELQDAHALDLGAAGSVTLLRRTPEEVPFFHRHLPDAVPMLLED